LQEQLCKRTRHSMVKKHYILSPRIPDQSSLPSPRSAKMHNDCMQQHMCIHITETDIPAETSQSVQTRAHDKYAHKQEARHTCIQGHPNLVTRHTSGVRLENPQATIYIYQHAAMGSCPLLPHVQSSVRLTQSPTPHQHAAVQGPGHTISHITTASCCSGP
jgi:hypothetical protein